MKVRFYDAGQALAALVELPDGRRILVDAGENPKRPACSPCREWHQRVVAGLTRDLGGTSIDLLWITHQHSDHLGGAANVTTAFDVKHYVDNGLDLDKPTVLKTREAATSRAVTGIDVQPRGPLPGNMIVSRSTMLSQTSRCRPLQGAGHRKGSPDDRDERRIR